MSVVSPVRNVVKEMFSGIVCGFLDYYTYVAGVV